MMISLCAHGMSVRDTICPLRHACGTGLSPETVSRITGHVLEEVRAWQPGPLGPVCEVAFPDAIVVRVQRAGAGGPARSSQVVTRIT
jgi:transposase-like protein